MLKRIAQAAFLMLLAAPIGCAAETTADDAEVAENDLSAIPTGSYAITSEPSSGNYISKLTLKAKKAFELEYVTQRTTYEPFFGNPFVTIPVTKKEAVVLRGTYMTFAGDGGTNISFDFSEGSISHLIYTLEVSAGAIRLKAIGESAFELRKGAADATPTDKRVLSCSARRWKATITLDDAQRRRGTLKITRNADADGNDPPNGSVTVVYTGDTGVDDYMAYEGTDADGGGYDFALRLSDLAKTSGNTAEVGLAYTRPYTSYGMHNALDCTIATR